MQNTWNMSTNRNYNWNLRGYDPEYNWNTCEPPGTWGLPKNGKEWVAGIGMEMTGLLFLLIMLALIRAT